MMIWWQGYNDLYTALRTPSHHVGLRSSLSTSHHHHDTVFPRSRQNCRVMRDDLNCHTFSTVADIPPKLSVIIKCLSLNSQARTQSVEERGEEFNYLSSCPHDWQEPLLNIPFWFSIWDGRYFKTYHERGERESPHQTLYTCWSFRKEGGAF